jgi:hypothetical protein
MKHAEYAGAAVLVIFLTFLAACQGAEEKPKSVTLPAGTRMVIRLEKTLGSKTSKPGEWFKSALVEPVLSGTETVIPKGSTVYGIVDEVKAVKMKVIKAKIEIVFDRIETPGGKVIPINAGIQKDFDAAGALRKAGGTVGESAANKALETATQGLITPLLIYKKGRSAIEFAQKDRNVVMPEGSVLQIALREPATVPSR